MLIDWRKNLNEIVSIRIYINKLERNCWSEIHGTSGAIVLRHCSFGTSHYPRENGKTAPNSSTATLQLIARYRQSIAGYGGKIQPTLMHPHHVALSSSFAPLYFQHVPQSGFSCFRISCSSSQSPRIGNWKFSSFQILSNRRIAIIDTNRNQRLDHRLRRCTK